MGEQAAEVAVPVFGDPTETPAMPTGVLARGEPQPTGKLASPSEGADMPHGPDQGRRGQEPNAGNLAQAPYDRVGVGEGSQVALECRDAGFDDALPPRTAQPEPLLPLEQGVLEAGKKRLVGDTAREVMSSEVVDLTEGSGPA